MIRITLACENGNSRTGPHRRDSERLALSWFKLLLSSGKHFGHGRTRKFTKGRRERIVDLSRRTANRGVRSWGIVCCRVQFEEEEFLTG